MTCPIGTDIRLAASMMREGGLVAFATETVYGLGADARNLQAIAHLFDVKYRPRFDPLIVHIADISRLDEIVSEVPLPAKKLATAFWPGPLTLVLPKTDLIPDLVTSGLPTVAVRIPAHPQALDLLRTADFPVAAPSANPFGRLSPTTAQHVAEQLSDQIDYILDGGPCRIGVESTVLQITADEGPRLLRPGGLPLEDIESVIGPVTVTALGTKEETNPQLSPGQLPRHYSPITPLVVQAADDPLPETARQSGLLTIYFRADTSKFATVENLSADGDLAEAAAGFFGALRRLDAMELDLIVAEPFPEHGLGRALNDRLRRAAHKASP